MEKNIRKKSLVKDILKYSIPSIIAMVLSSAITVVDGLFISNIIGKDTLAAINLGMPMLYIFLAIGIMIGVGGASLAGRRLGKGDIDKSVNVFNQTIFTAIIILFSLSLGLRVSFEYILNIFNIAKVTMRIMTRYYNILLWMYPMMMLNIILGMFLRCEKKHHIFMINTFIITLINISLDYLFIARMNLGVSGAARASGISIFIGTILMIINFNDIKSVFVFKRFKYLKSDLKKTILNGGSEFIGQISLSITMFFLNIVVIKNLGINGIAAVTIIGYTGYIVNMIVVGFGQGISPLVSYNYGAGNSVVCNKLRSETSKMVIIIGVILFIILSIFPRVYAKLFSDNRNLIDLVSFGLPLYSISFVAIGYNIITSFYFTGVGYAKESAIISTSRSLVLLLINILILPFIFGKVGIFIIAPVTEIITLVISYYLLKYSLKEEKNIIREVSS